MTRCSQLLLLALLAVSYSVAACTHLFAKDTDPLYLQSPFDEVTLDENNNSAVLKVQPLNLLGRKVPAPADRKGDLEIELVEQAGQRFAVAWGAVVKVRLFEELVLAEANERVQQGRFDEAYPYFRFLEAKTPPVAGLKDAIETCLWTQIGTSFKAGRQDEAMALLAELSGRNPQRTGLPKAYERVSLELAKSRIAEGNYRAARKILGNLGDRYPDTKATSVAESETMLKEKAAALLAQSKADLAAGKLREAHEAAGKMLEIWPTIEDGKQLAAEVHQKFPLLSVGVISPLAAAPLKSSDDWATVRSGPLLGRPIAEPTGVEGAGTYTSSFGEISRTKGKGNQLALKLKEGLKWQDPPRNLSSQDIIRSLFAAATPNAPGFDEPFSKVLAGVDVGADREVRVEFLHAQLRGEAWLNRPLPGYGPYKLATATPQQVSYLRQVAYFNGEAAAGVQPAEIIERTYLDSATAIQALRRGEVNMVDRISPWDLRRISSGEEFTVEPYASPRVSVLVPNPRRPLLANRTLRRAVLFAIDRESILRRGLLTGQSIAGCEVVSGPFPKPANKEDFQGGGYNEQVEVRPYDPAVASVLVATALQETAVPPSTSVTLAFPAEPISRIACESIARQLELVGLQVKLKEIPAGQTAGEDYDLLYMELVMQEPLVDAWRLLGPGGTTGQCSSAMLLALRSLEGAKDVKQAELRLEEVHRIAAAELPVIPLWQMVNHFAYHKSVKGVPQRPRHLYQDIEHWQVELRVPNE
ncbi:MAG: hypothetical protein K8R36_22855 [Planctomycetales bacterium]|nr:hypothetical protein [Planctomycetales bacterium]